MSPVELAAFIGEHEPTVQQAAVIEATTTEPHLVVAGAGSGKTATMANRVVWLVANGHVQPSEVLGLTFTRKAAGELDARIAKQLSRFERASGQTESDALAADRPTVSTYNAFAAAVYRDHALLIGYEPDAIVISESVAWRLAHSVVVRSTDPRLAQLDLTPTTLVDAVLSFARELADHGASGSEVRAYAERTVAEAAPLVDSIRQKLRREKIQGYLDNVALLPLLVDLAAEYQSAKRARGYIEFSDQVALAHRIITEHPSVAATYRQRYRIVLLDEYQDTSVAQTRFLAELFRGSGVMAVGDPDQSIYGFRGASAANLSRFATDFGAGESYPLSISWRNSLAVLDVANSVMSNLERTSGVEKPLLDPNGRAGRGSVELHYAETVLDEARVVADWFASKRNQSGEPPTMALLLRAKKHFPVFAEALRAQGIPVHILGLSGLLAEPVIVDLVSALAVLSDSTANAELVRLLAGARWAIGPADIRELHRLASRLASHDAQGNRRPDAQIEAARHSAEEIDTASLVEALDELAAGRIPRAEWLEGFSAVGLDRLREAGAEFARLRRRSGLRLADIVEATITELRLDIEANANPTATLASQSLEAFHELVADYLALAEDASLGGFLEWLEAAEQRESLAPRQDPPEPGAVQMMTIHAAKGLEWDVVALGRWVTDEMPSKPQDVAGWLGRGRLPYRFRGDRDELPALAWQDLTDTEQLERALEGYLGEVRAHQLAEEWRLGYVAVTRPRDELLITGSWWGGQVKSREPGSILRTIANHLLGAEAAEWPAASLLDGPPQLGLSAGTWPLDPLGSRAAIVSAAATAVRSAGPLRDEALGELIDVLLAERDQTGQLQIERPIRIPASRVKDWLAEPEQVLAELQRPMPQKPYTATRLGTLFHRWVEHRPLEGVEIDAFEDELEASDGVESDRFDTLKATFAASPWGALKPVDIEREIHVPIAGSVFICKIDAVYDLHGIEIGQPEGTRWQIVDWKTGAAPRDEADLELKQTQLALYRIAYARHLGIDPATIDAVFYFVADDLILRPAALLDEAAFAAAWAARAST